MVSREKTRLGEFLDGGFRLLGTGVATLGMLICEDSFMASNFTVAVI